MRTQPKTPATGTQRFTGPRYSAQFSYFPSRFLVWDHLKGDNLRGAELNGRRFPWFTTMGAAQKVADRLNAKA